MASLRILTLPLVAALLLAGCAGSKGGSAPEAEADFSELDLEATSTTGIIRGVVVDQAIRPLAGAVVTLQGDKGAAITTTDEGTFGFGDLEPGTYFLSVQKFGYLPVQQSAEVVAGDAEPPIVKVLLVSDGKPAPYAVGFVYEGFIECGTSAVALCGGVHDVVVIACSNSPVCLPQPTNDQYSGFIFIDGTPSYLQTEMVWDSTQALSTDMNYALRYSDQETYNNGMYEGGFGSSRGPSPLMNNVTGEEAAEAELGNRTGLVFSIFSGTGSYPVGATVQQRYSMYVHTFYGYTPDQAWRFTTDGEPQPLR